MLKNIAHVGLTVSNLEKSIEFYQNTLGLTYQGQLLMEGEETEKLFGMASCKVRVAYLNGSTELMAPPVELIQFVGTDIQSKGNQLNQLSISELCFYVSDIDSIYEKLLDKGIEFLSKPQYFDYTTQGFGKSKAVYFKDPDGIILELMECID
ncbi:VOC family protein [uncultured Clostridium sp.]|uniref:VOC family protein n=1 Tax=uncultured Clostridium sp. TaxID=59620 RepID=UPI0032165D7E